MREWLARLWDWARRDRLDAEVVEELRFHREQLERAAKAAGASDPQAALAARRRLGNDLRVREEARERWSWPWLDHLQQDLRQAVRGLRRAPGFTTAVVVTLALGLGANAAMFAIIDRLMLRSPAYLRDPASVNRVYLSAFERDEEQRTHNFEFTRYLDFQRWTSSFAETAAFFPATLTAGLGVELREVEAEAVSASFWGFFAMRPEIGRFFGEAEDRLPQGAAVVVVSSRYCKTELGGRPDILGTTLQIGALRFTVIGVAPDGFVGVAAGRSPPQLFIPVTTVWATYGEGIDGLVVSIADQYTKYIGSGSLGGAEMLVRRKPDVTEAMATADLTHALGLSYEVQRGLDSSLPPSEVARPRAMAGPVQIYGCLVSRTTSCASDGPPEGRIALWVGALAAIVLLIAGANVANLILARAASRRREIAMRRALGIGRRRLVAHVLIETLLLAFLGCVIGLVVAELASTLLASLFLPAGESVSIVRDPRTILVAVVAAVTVGLAIGWFPTMRVGQDDLAATLKAGARDGPYRRSRLRSTLVVVQATLSVVLLVGAGLFVRSLNNVRGLRLGYDVDPTLRGLIHLRGKAPSPEEKTRLLSRLRDEAASIPGVVSASRSSNGADQFSGRMVFPLAVPGIESVEALGSFTPQLASAEHLNTVGTRLIRGRGITAADRRGTPQIIVVSEAMARRLWPGLDALGRCVRIGGSTAPCATVVGIAENARLHGLADVGLNYYLSIDQFDATDATLYIRTAGDAQQFSEAIRRRLQPLMPGISYIAITPMRDLVDEQFRQWRLGALMFITLGSLALVLAAVGLYSVIAYGVAQRTQELGVRVAVGARTSSIVRLVVVEGVWLTAIGVALGAAIAGAGGPWVAPFLFAVGPRDPLVFGSVGGALLVVAILASLVPAVRASRVDPNIALRSD